MTAIRALMRDGGSFIIAGHTNPDGDAVGGCYALALALEKLGKKVIVVLEPYAKKFDIIPGRHLRYVGPLEDLTADVLFCVDCADAGRLGAAQPLLSRITETVCIDHHSTNKGYTKYDFVDGKVSSASELVFRLIEGFVEIDRDIASAIYAGMVNDTGGFRFSATSEGTLAIAGKLMALGIPFTDIYTEMSHRHTFTEAKIFARALDVCERTPDGRVAYTCVTRTMLDELSATGQDMDGVVEYLLNIRGVDVSVLLYDKTQTEVKVSLRSRRTDISRIASGLGGGGHALAAGINLSGNIYEVKDKVLALVAQELANE